MATILYTTAFISDIEPLVISSVLTSGSSCDWPGPIGVTASDVSDTVGVSVGCGSVEVVAPVSVVGRDSSRTGIDNIVE